jgi:hypothetical protein
MALSQQVQDPAKTDQMFETPPMIPACSPELTRLVTPVSENYPQRIAPVLRPVSALLVTNLPSVLFSQVSDLHPLLCPFGEIVDLKIVSEDAQAGTITVFVEYQTSSQAEEARATLRAQRYTSEPVNAEYVQPNPQAAVNSELDLWPPSGFSAGKGLNPLAAPFFAERTYTPNQYVVPVKDGARDVNYKERHSVSHIVTRRNSPFMELPTPCSNVAPSSGLYGIPFVTHRPHSAPSEYVHH